MTNPVWTPVGRVQAGEAVPFTNAGPLMAREGRTRFPITGGAYAITVVAARLGTAPVGGPVRIDIKVNGVSIYPDDASKPTFAPGATLAVVAAHTPTEVADGDYLSVDIEQVGPTAPGSDLVVTVRLQRIP